MAIDVSTKEKCEALGQKWKEGKCDLSSSILRESDLRWSSFVRSDLTGSTLEKSNLEGSFFTGSNLRRSFLNVCDLTRSDLSGSNLTKSDLSRSILNMTDLRNARIKNVAISPTCRIRDPTEEEKKEWSKRLWGEEIEKILECD